MMWAAHDRQQILLHMLVLYESTLETLCFFVFSIGHLDFIVHDKRQNSFLWGSRSEGAAQTPLLVVY